MVNKKAISPVITTILLILVAIAAVAFVASVVIPFIKEQLSDRGDCFKAIDQVDIDTKSKYTCWTTKDDGSGEIVVSVSVKRGSEPLGIERFVITVFGEGRSERFDVTNGSLGDGRMFMFDGTKDGTGSSASNLMIVPQLGEMRTYVLNTTLKEVGSVNIAPVIKGNNMCDEVDRKSIGDSLCSSIFS